MAGLTCLTLVIIHSVNLTKHSAAPQSHGSESLYNTYSCKRMQTQNQKETKYKGKENEKEMKSVIYLPLSHLRVKEKHTVLISHK